MLLPRIGISLRLGITILVQYHTVSLGFLKYSMSFPFLMYTILVAGIISKFSDMFRNSESVVSFVVPRSMYPTWYNSGLSWYKALLKISATFPFLVMIYLSSQNYFR